MESKHILGTIGNTPLVKIQKLNPNPLVDIFVKLEFMNPSGSIKDRIVDYMINEAEKEGLLKPGGTIIENTSGNTGAAVAMIAAIKGYKAMLTMPDKVSKEKQSALKAYGAEIVVTPTSADPDSPEHYVNVAKRLAKETPNSFRLNQYDNQKNAEAHYNSTGPEIWQQTNGKVDYFVASGSTGGTISGVGKYLKEKKPTTKVVMVDPIGSIYYDYFKTRNLKHVKKQNYCVEGIGQDHLVEVMNFDLIDEMYRGTDQDAFTMSRLLAREEGILAGGSSGMNVWAAIKLAKTLTKKTTIVTVLPDHGIKYLSTFHNDDWMLQHNFSIS